MSEPLSYWEQSDDWQKKSGLGAGSAEISWQKIDYYEGKGYLTSDQVDLLHAYGSVLADNQGPRDVSGGGYQDMESAYQALQSVDQAHSGELDSASTPPAPSSDLSPPPPSFGPGMGIDYQSQSWAGLDPPGAVPSPPKVPASGNGQPGSVAVNTDALNVFAKNMLSLNDMINTASGYVNEVNIKPGGFYSAFQLRDLILGQGSSDGLKNDTIKFLNNTSSALVDLHNDLAKLVLDYQNGEDVNSMTADTLATILSPAYSDIDNSSQFGSVSGDKNGSGSGNSGSGSGSGGSGGSGGSST